VATAGATIIANFRAVSASAEDSAASSAGTQAILQEGGSQKVKVMNRFTRALLIFVVVAGVVAGVYLYVIPRRVNAATNVPTVAAQLGDIAATVSGAGNITPNQQVVLNFSQAGTVQSVPVQVGDQVKAGQVLASLDTTTLKLDVQNAQANLQAAQDKLTQAKEPNSPQDIASAKAALDAAKANYDKLTAPPKAADIAAAQAAVASAQAGYNAAVKTAGTSSSQMNAAAEAVQQAQAALQAAQAAYDKVAGAPNIGMLPQSVTLQQNTIAYQTALDNYQTLQATSTSNNNSTIQQAKSQLDTALANLAKTETPNTPQDIQTAKDQVAEAQDSLDKLLAGSTPATINIAQTGVDQAQVALQQAQIALQQAQIVAPFAGVVTAVNVTQGQTESSNGQTGAIELADLNHLELTVAMAETDVVNVKVGQQAQITLDALPNVNLTGTVTQIAPVGTISQGVVNYPVTVALTRPPTSVKTGMTATVNIITQQANNVLVVPNRAVHTQGRTKYVTVLFEGQQMQVPVTTGLSSDTLTQITSGLKQGDQVVLTSTSTTPTRVGGPGGRFFPGG
jgi:HlyD family secretion protein